MLTTTTSLSSSLAFTSLKNEMETTLAADQVPPKDWTILAARATGFFNEPATLVDQLEKIADESTKEVEEIRSTMKTAYTVMLSLEAFDKSRPAAMQQQQQQQQTSSENEVALKEVAVMKQNVLSKQFGADAEEAQLISWVQTWMKQLSPKARALEEGGDWTAVPPIPGVKVADPKGLLELLCQVSAPKHASWWRLSGKALSWEQLLGLAEVTATEYAPQTEWTILSDFLKFVAEFNWEKEYEGQAGMPSPPPSAVFAQGASRILSRSPSYAAGTDGWVYIGHAREKIPPFVKAAAGAAELEATNARTYLRVIGNVPRSVFETEKTRKQKLREEIEEIARSQAGGILSGMSREVSKDLREIRSFVSSQAATMRAETAEQVRASTAKASRLEEKFVADAPSLPKEAIPFKETPVSTTALEECKAMTFPATSKGRKDYEKAMASFLKEFPGEKAASAPATARFPLTPGSFPVPSYSCDRCRMSDQHIASRCTNPSLQPAERNYRRIWRAIMNANRAPRFARAGMGKRINMVAEEEETIDELLEAHKDRFYLGHKGEPRDEDETSPMNVWLAKEETEAIRSLWLVQLGEDKVPGKAEARKRRTSFSRRPTVHPSVEQPSAGEKALLTAKSGLHSRFPRG